MFVTPYIILHIYVTRLAHCVPPGAVKQRSVEAFCDKCNRSFLSDKCYENYLTLRVK
jgi:hypothetical protein